MWIQKSERKTAGRDNGSTQIAPVLSLLMAALLIVEPFVTSGGSIENPLPVPAIRCCQMTNEVPEAEATTVANIGNYCFFDIQWLRVKILVSR